MSAIGATLGMGGWLDPTQWGLAPHKKHQASLGAHRGRAVSYLTDPTQIPASGTTAPGSSVILSSQSTKTGQIMIQFLVDRRG
jgi:hypothetical protein